MLKITDQYFWNLIFGLFFVVVAIMLAIILETESRLVLTDLQLVDYTLIVLASWRLSRLLVDDSVTKWLREQFWDLKKVGRGHTLVKPKTGPRRTLADLFSCTWCMGVWTTTIVSFFYLLTPYALYPVIILALAAVVSSLHIAIRYLGYMAKQVQVENEGS